MATYQSVTEADRIVVRPHLDRARDSLRAAELLRDAELHGDSAARAHQSTVHAERALLATEKRSPQTPRSVHRLTMQHFIENDLLDRRHAAALDGLAALRVTADEVPASSLTDDESAAAIATATAFLDEATDFLRAAGHEVDGGG